MVVGGCAHPRSAGQGAGGWRRSLWSAPGTAWSLRSQAPARVRRPGPSRTAPGPESCSRYAPEA